MNLSSTLLVPSAAPDVVFVFNAPNDFRRSQAAGATTAASFYLHNVLDIASALPEKPSGAGDLIRAAMLAETAQALRTAIDAAYLRVFLKEVRGLLLDGKPVDTERFITDSPSALFQDAVRKMRDLLHAPEQQAPNPAPLAPVVN